MYKSNGILTYVKVELLPRVQKKRPNTKSWRWIYFHIPKLERLAKVIVGEQLTHLSLGDDSA
jgi:hypothetical protein